MSISSLRSSSSSPPDRDSAESDTNLHLRPYSDTLIRPFPSADQPLVRSFLSTLLTPSKSREPELSMPLDSLLSSSRVSHFHIGTGFSVLQQICEAIAAAESEVLFATCFWADSPSLEVLYHALRRLNNRQGIRIPRVRILFSSRSLKQKLFHTASPKGTEWTTEQLGLPPSQELADLDIECRSVFYLPFSVLHQKFVIIDRKKVFLPSANVSWEVWLEQLTVLEGPIVSSFFDFWKTMWIDDSDAPDTLPPVSCQKTSADLPTILLPQTHHRNPGFFSSPPKTPQNVFFATLLAHARKSVYLQTPNLTSRPVIAAIKEAVARGVTVHIVTVPRMMTIEQLITTLGTAITELCVWSLARWARRSSSTRDLLNIWYYKPADTGTVEEPVKSHVKALVVDGRISVVGSANADRASWWTSGEINVAVFGEEYAEKAKGGLCDAVKMRAKKICGGAEEVGGEVKPGEV